MNYCPRAKNINIEDKKRVTRIIVSEY